VPGVDMVTIVEIMPRLLPRQLDQRGAQMLQRMIEGPRLSFRLGAEVHAFLGDRQVRGVRLADGGQLAAETVLVSAGISPRITLAREAGLRVRKGVIVDEYLRTSVEHIWAAGDIVEFQGIVWGIIPAAMDHAPVVAANLLGGEGESAPAAQRPESAPPAQRPESAPPAQRSESAPPAQRLVAYHQTIPQNTLKVAGVNVTSIGKVIFEKDEESRYQVIEKADEAKGRYEKYVMQNGILMGCILLGPRDNYGFATQRIGKPVTVEEIRIRLW
jgi:NAD(P)H-nitrite reductase large subunit